MRVIQIFMAFYGLLSFFLIIIKTLILKLVSSIVESSHRDQFNDAFALADYVSLSDELRSPQSDSHHTNSLSPFVQEIAHAKSKIPNYRSNIQQQISADPRRSSSVNGVPENPENQTEPTIGE